MANLCVVVGQQGTDANDIRVSMYPGHLLTEPQAPALECTDANNLQIEALL